MVATVRTRKRNGAAAERLINRELSFLDYDARLLELARDETLPLLERVFFLKVSAEMLDEFFDRLEAEIRTLALEKCERQ